MESRTQKIKRLREEIESLEMEEQEEMKLSPVQRMAIELHRYLCHSNHIDECGWDYEKDWQGYAHKRWLDTAEKLDAMNLTIEQMRKIAEILGRVR